MLEMLKKLELNGNVFTITTKDGNYCNFNYKGEEIETVFVLKEILTDVFHFDKSSDIYKLASYYNIDYTDEIACCSLYNEKQDLSECLHDFFTDEEIKEMNEYFEIC